MLQIENVSKTYRRGDTLVRAIDAVSLELTSGCFVAVRGPSGCGKSTLLLVLGGLLAPESGHVRHEGTDLYALSSEQRAGWRAANVGFVFQQFHLVPYLNILDNVCTPALALPTVAAPERARQLLEQVGLSHRLSHVPAELSTGERQRVALARALLNRPRLLLADEPTGNLDAANAKIVLAHLAAFAKAGGIVLLVTHDVEAVKQADHILTMNDGRILP